MALHLQTPLLPSPALSARAGCEVWLKMEALQPPGSFKIRGIGALCEAEAARGKRRFICSSGGNAGIAAAHAGRRLGLEVTVFVPQTTSDRAKTLIAGEGGRVVVQGASWAEANAAALAALDGESAFIHPFDDPVVWAGHATLIDEAVAAGPGFDAVVVAVGGGGLMLGIAEGLSRAGLDAVPILAAETEGAASLAASMRSGRLEMLPAITSLATSLGARQVAAAALELTRNRPVRSHVVSDRAAVAACLSFLDEHRVLVEPACGAALALADAPSRPLAGFGRVLMAVCGGATTTLGQLEAWSRA